MQQVGLPAAHTAVDLSPENARALDVLGWSQYRTASFYSAEQNLLAALEIDPDLAIAHYHLAFVYLETGDRASAHDQLLRTRELDPGGWTGELAAQVLSEYFP